MIKEILVSYWWIILIVIIVVSVITRKLIKALISLIIIAVITMAIFLFFVFPKTTPIGDCYMADLKNTNTIGEATVKLKSPEERLQYFCPAMQKNFNSLTKCIQDQNVKSDLSYKLYSMFSNSNKEMTEIVDTHNAKCPNNKISVPSFVEL